MITREQFDQVYNGLAAQGWQRSMLPDGSLCAFRGANNTKCAIGQLIPDDQYDPDMDNYTRSWGWRDFIDVGLIPGISLSEFDELQSAHDNTSDEDPSEMKDAFDALRDRWFPS